MTVIILIFAALAALDYLFGSKFGISKEFENGFMLLGTMVLSMLGMIVISPLLAQVLAPVFDGAYQYLGMEPSLIPAMLFANDMGGAPLAVEVAKNPELGNFNALVVSSMMGATVSFTIPLSLQMVDREHTQSLVIGLLCGIITIPLGCFLAGLLCGIPVGLLCMDLLPLLILSIVIAVMLLVVPRICVKIFCGLGFFIRVLIVIGMMLGAVNFLSGKEVIPGLGTVEEAAMVCVNASFVMAGMFPLVHIASKLLTRPFGYLGGKLGINSSSVTGLLATLATNVTTFKLMNEMDPKGTVLNSAFAVSAAFTFAGHLAFTMAFNEEYLLPVVVGKLSAGILALVLALVMSVLLNRKNEKGV